MPSAVGVLNIGDELVFVHQHFGNIHQVGWIALFAPGEGGRGCEPPCVASHDLEYRYRGGSGERLGVEAGTDDGGGDKPRRATVSGTVVGQDEIVVNRLGNVDHGEVVACLGSPCLERVAGLGGVVAAYDEPVADAEPVEILEDRFYVVVP